MMPTSKSSGLHLLPNEPIEPKTAEKAFDIGGIIGIVPIVVFYRNQPALARTAALEHLALTHPGAPMRTAATLIVDLLLAVLAGTPLRKAVAAQIAARKNPQRELPPSHRKENDANNNGEDLNYDNRIAGGFRMCR